MGPIIKGENVYISETAILGHPGKKNKDLLITGRFNGLRPVKIKDDVLLRDHTVVYEGVSLGTGVETGHRVLIREDTDIGEHTVVGSGTIIEAGCEIGKKVSIQSSVYLANGTKVLDDAFLGPMVCLINDKYMDGRIQPCTIGEDARIGAGSTIFPGVSVGKGAVVGADSLVTKDIPNNKKAFGRPAKLRG
ncbi:MAG: acyltransferase [Thermoplasmata archaeon]